MANNNEKKIDPALLDELLKNQDPQTVFSSEGLLGDLKKGLAERMLDAEMDVHLAADTAGRMGDLPAAMACLDALPEAVLDHPRVSLKHVERSQTVR